MLDPIKLSDIASSKSIEETKLLEKFSINILLKDEQDELFIENDNYYSNIFNEAIFVNGRESVKLIEDQFQVIKNTLDEELKSSGKEFDPTKFLKNTVWKELEERMVQVFGFRYMEVENMEEHYDGRVFKSWYGLNCFTWCNWRYPIDGLVTDKGFYDSTHSIHARIVFTMGIIRELSAGELTAIFLHELGHNIDPALVDIKYIETNILSDYLVEGRISKKNSAYFKLFKERYSSVLPDGIILLIIFGSLFLLNWLVNNLKDLFFNPQKTIKKIVALIKSDKDKFTRQRNQEAFADNFARMYGYGAALISAFDKINIYSDKEMESRIKKEVRRQRLIADITEYLIKDIHKTDIHRIHSLLKEYKADLENPNIPNEVKVGIKEDYEAFQKVVNGYINSRDEFSNNLNKAILDELEKLDPTNIDVEVLNKIGKNNIIKNTNNAKEVVNINNESTELLEEKKKHNKHIPLSKEDYEEIKKHFGDKNHECSFAKDKDGYFVHTHRARSKSVPSISKITKKDYDFISSTS